MLIGHQETRPAMAHDDAKSIGVGELTFNVRGDIRPGAAVGEIFLDRRIEVAIRVGKIRADTHRVASPAVLAHDVAAGRAETAARRHDAAVESLAGVARRDHFDDAAELPAVLGWVTASEDT